MQGGGWCWYGTNCAKVSQFDKASSKKGFFKEKE